MSNHNDKSIGKLISILYRQFQIYINRSLKEYNINSSEYIFLINISHHGGTNQKTLSDKLIIDQAFTTRVMKNLENKGFITRERNSKDKREYNIYLTEMGKKVQPIIIEKLRNWTSILSGDLDKNEVDRMIILLNEMCNNALKETRGDEYE